MAQSYVADDSAFIPKLIWLLGCKKLSDSSVIVDTANGATNQWDKLQEIADVLQTLTLQQQRVGMGRRPGTVESIKRVLQIRAGTSHIDPTQIDLEANTIAQFVESAKSELLQTVRAHETSLIVQQLLCAMLAGGGLGHLERADGVEYLKNLFHRLAEASTRVQLRSTGAGVQREDRLSAAAAEMPADARRRESGQDVALGEQGGFAPDWPEINGRAPEVRRGADELAAAADMNRLAAAARERLADQDMERPAAEVSDRFLGMGLAAAVGEQDRLAAEARQERVDETTQQSARDSVQPLPEDKKPQKPKQILSRTTKVIAGALLATGALLLMK
jgi:hypothetical protein